MPCKLTLTVESINEATDITVEETLETTILVIEDSVCPVATVEISPTPDNIIEQLPDGLYVPTVVASWGNSEW